MLIYWLLFALFVLGAIYFEQRPIDKLPTAPIVLANSLTALIIGFRYKVGADWESYWLIFNQMRYISLGSALTNSDPAYGALNWVVKQLGLKLWVVNLTCASFFVYGLHKFARRQSSAWLTMAVALPYLVIVVGMGYTRQAAALGFVFLGLNAIQDKRFRSFLMFMLLASLFHRSALLLLPIVALSYSQNRFVTLILGFAATVLGYYFVVAPQVDTYINRYSGVEQGAVESQGTVVRLIMNIVPAVLFFAFRSRFPALGDYTKVWRNFSFIAILSFLFYLYLGNNTAIDRLSIYMVPLQLFILGNLPLVLRGERENSRLALLMILVYAVVIQAVWLVFSKNAEFWVPYRFFPV